MKKLFAKALFRSKERINAFMAFFRRLILRLQGAKIGRTIIRHPLHMTWPHRVSIGDRCRLERDVILKVDGIYEPKLAIEIGDDVFIGSQVEMNIKLSVRVGDHCLIASGCRFVDHDHSIAPGEPIGKQAYPDPAAAITLGQNVWLGANVVVLKGVDIGSGAVVAAGAVVTKSIPAQEIWGGVPAKKIGHRMHK